MRDADAQHTSQEPDPDYETEKEQPEYVKGEVLVKFREGADPQEVIYYTALSGASVERIHTIEPITKKFLKDYKLEKDSDGWYWFLGKNYKEIEEIPEEEAFQQAYQNMSPAKKSLYRWHKIALPVGMSVEEAITELEDNPDIEYAEPNYISRVFYVPNDPMYSQQWAHQKTQAEAAWDMERGNPDVVIAIIDTGVAYNHQDLAANIWRDSQNNPGRDFVDINFAEYDPARYQLLPGEDYTDIDDDPSDYHGHGSHCAGITAAVGSNSIGVAGACHNCSIMPVRAGFSILYWNQDFEIWQEVGQFENDDMFLARAYAADSGSANARDP